MELIVGCLLLLFGTCLAADKELNVENNFRNMMVRLNDDKSHPPGHIIREGRVEVSFNNGHSWGTVCGSAWSKREGNVVCRQLGLGFALASMQSTRFGTSSQHPWGVVGTLCRGNEKKLSECRRESRYPHVCNAANHNISIVQCVEKSPDLQIGLPEIQQSARLESVPMTRLTCAMEENCVSRDAYIIRRTNPGAIRKLLRFSVKAENLGTADVSPYVNHREWEWHQCHNHFHSMKIFSTFDIYDFNYRKMAQGHKASFCLMDTSCRPGYQQKYTCGNTTQGISVGCADTYTAGLDCQWVDVTNVPVNRKYILRIALNPEYILNEISFENNSAECILNYTGIDRTTTISDCQMKPLWFQI